MKSRYAFTLIELLVVIAIIAILAAILFPVFAAAKESAKKTRSLAQMKQLSISVMLYASDYDDFFEERSMQRALGHGYSDATGVDPNSTAEPGAAPPGTEGFRTAVSFSVAEEPASVGLFATTPGSVDGKERGYVFNPYNGPDSPDGEYKKGLPLIADVNLCFNSPLSPGALKPIFARYGADGEGKGQTPVIFADGHAKMYSADALNVHGKVIWRFR